MGSHTDAASRITQYPPRVITCVSDSPSKLRSTRHETHSRPHQVSTAVSEGVSGNSQGSKMRDVTSWQRPSGFPHTLHPIELGGIGIDQGW